MKSSVLPLSLLCLLLSLPASAQTPEDPAVVRAEAPIVAGNAVTAKKRALSDAFRQTVERAFSELLAQGGETKETPRMQQLKSSLAGSGQKYIRKYRILEQEEVAGQLKLMVEAEVETVLLRQEIEKAGAVAATPSPPADRPASSLVVLGGALPAELAPVLTKALATIGLKAQLNPAGDAAALLTLAAKGNGTALFVKAQAAGEGVVRGTVRTSATCTAVYQWLAPNASKPLMESREQERSTASDEAGARVACFERLSTQLARSLAVVARAPGTRSPYFTLALDAIEPGALPVVVASLKRLGAVAATEVRLVTPTQSELRIFTRLAPTALQPMLAREVAGKLTITTTSVGPDRLVLKVRTPQHSDLVTP